MLTFFTTGKPFEGHNGIIQRNALQSWKLLHPDVEVILFGSEEGAVEVCRNLGLHHEPEMERSRLGAPRADFMFRRAREIARHDVVCYVNCDIILTREFCHALETLLAWRSRFLMVGRRWDTDITEPLDFSQPDWEERVIARAHTEGIQRFYNCVDFFLFPRGLYAEMPGLVVGRAWWDHWMVWKALAENAPVVDASEAVCAVHQNHDYSSHPQGMRGTWHDEDAQRNLQFAEARKRTIEDATFRLTAAGIQPNHFHWLAPAKRRVRWTKSRVRAFVRTRIWHPFLDRTRTLRQSLGLRQSALPAMVKLKRSRRSPLDDGN